MKEFKRNKQLQDRVLDYLNKINPELKLSQKGMFECPFCDKHNDTTNKSTANIFPENSGKVYCFDPNCGKLGDIYDLCRRIEFDNNKDVDDSDIESYLIDILDIQLNNPVKELFEKFKKWGWSLVPVIKNGKIPVEKDWTNKTHYDITEWNQWHKSGNNLGVRTGKVSNVIVVDCDILTKKESEIIEKGTATKTIEELLQKKQEGIEKLKELDFFKDTLYQDSGVKGIHFFFQYDEEIPKTYFDYDGYHFDVEADGGYVLVEPSTSQGKTRVIVGDEIKPLPEDLKKFILDNYKNKKSDNVETDVGWDDGPIAKEFEGCRNNTLVKTLGQLRKFMTVDQVERTAHLLNQQWLQEPLENREVKAMCSSINSYHVVDISEIGKAILKHLDIVEEAHIRDLKDSLGYDRKDLDYALNELLNKNKIIKKKKDLYESIKDVKWRTDFVELNKPLPFNIPFFGKYINFIEGSMVVIGGKTGTGKTHIVMNIVKPLVEQGIKPKIISTEAGSGIGEIALAMGLKEGDFEFIITSKPTQIPFEKGDVVLLDWLSAPKGEYNKLEVVYSELNDRLVDSGGVLFVFAQLRQETATFYADDMVRFYARVIAKFLYPDLNGKPSSEFPEFVVEKARGTKIGTQFFKIPLQYDRKTSTLIELPNEKYLG